MRENKRFLAGKKKKEVLHWRNDKNNVKSLFCFTGSAFFFTFILKHFLVQKTFFCLSRDRFLQCAKL